MFVEWPGSVETKSYFQHSRIYYNNPENKWYCDNVAMQCQAMRASMSERCYNVEVCTWTPVRLRILTLQEWLYYLNRNVRKRQKKEKYLWASAPSGTFVQHSRNLIRIFTGCILDSQGCTISSCGQRRLTEVSLGALVKRYIFSSCCSFHSK